jgi:methyl-accepting chemotaxis protein
MLILILFGKVLQNNLTFFGKVLQNNLTFFVKVLQNNLTFFGKEGLTNNDTIILMGDSILNNSIYVPEGKSVYDCVKTKLDKVILTAKDGATINDLYEQLDKIPIELNNSSTFIFISIGGNDILTKRITLNSNEIEELFDNYMNFLQALKTKIGSVKINILNLYLPTNPRYQIYKSTVEQWNKLINTNSNKIGEIYNILDLYSLLTNSNDFVYDIEPSAIASNKIANLIYLTR